MNLNFNLLLHHFVSIVGQTCHLLDNEGVYVAI